MVIDGKAKRIKEEELKKLEQTIQEETARKLEVEQQSTKVKEELEKLKENSATLQQQLKEKDQKLQELYPQVEEHSRLAFRYFYLLKELISKSRSNSRTTSN